MLDTLTTKSVDLENETPHFLWKPNENLLESRNEDILYCFIDFCKKYFFKDGRFPLCFENSLNLSFFDQNKN